MIRKRFPAIRTTRITAWTTVAVAWAIALVGRQVTAPAEEASPPTSTPPPTVAVDSKAGSTMPTLPSDGLVIIRYTPAPPPEPVVQQVVVQSAPSRPATVSTSQGS